MPQAAFVLAAVRPVAKGSAQARAQVIRLIYSLMLGYITLDLHPGGKHAAGVGEAEEIEALAILQQQRVKQIRLRRGSH